MSPDVINAAEEIRRILAAACEGRELLFLVTPYIRFESNFLRLEPDGLHVRITMGVEEATYALRSADLHLRFPAATRFLEGPTKALGFGMVDGRRSIRLAIPKTLKDDEQRGSYRVERVGRVEVTYSTDRYQLDTATLGNISTTGVRITAQQHPEGMGIQAGSVLSLSIPLTEEIRIHAKAAVRWMNGRALGLQFSGNIPEDTLVALTRWIFQKREEELERVARGPTLPPAGGPATAAPSGVTLISTSEVLERNLQSGWGGLPSLTRIPPVAQALKDALAKAPQLILFHLPDASLDTRRRAKTLAETVAGKVPIFLLGTGVPQETLFELGTELKATSVFGLQATPTPFFFRLLQGILNRQSESKSP